MASGLHIVGKETIDDIVRTDNAITKLDQSLMAFVKSTNLLTKQLNEVKKSNESTNAKTSEYAKILNKAAADQNKLTATAKEHANIQKQTTTIEAKLATARTESNKQLTEKKINLQQVNKLTKDEVILNSKSAGTIEKLTAKNRILEQQKKKLNLETKAGQKALKEINKEQDKNNKILAKSANAVQAQKNNIGNYKSAIAGISNGFKTLLANPVVLFLTGITLALKQLKDAFSSSERGRELMAKGLGVLKGIGQVIFNVFSKLTEALINAFENPKEAINDLWKTIKENLINRVTAIPEYYKGIFNTLAATFRLLGAKIKLALSDVPIIGKNIDPEKSKKAVADALDDMKKSALDTGQALVQITTGLDKMQQQNAVELLNGQFKEANELIKATIALEERELQLKISRIEFITKEAELNRDITRLRSEASDQTTTAERGLEAIAEIETKIGELIDGQKKLKQEELNILAQKNALGKNTLEDTERERTLQADLIKLDEQRATEQRALLRLTSRRLDQIADKTINQSLEEQQILFEGIKQQLLEGIITTKEYEQAQRDVVIKGINVQIDAIDRVLSDTEVSEAKRIMLAKQRSNLEKQLTNSQIQDFIKNSEKEEEINKLRIDAAIAEKERQYQRELILIESTSKTEEEKRSRINELNKSYVSDEIAAIQNILDNSNISAEERLKIEQDLADAKLELNQIVADDDKAKDEERKKRIQDIASSVIAIGQELLAFTQARTARELELLERKNQKGLLSEQEYAKQKAELELKAAKQERAAALFGIAINTASAIVKTSSQLGFPAAIPFIAIAAASGAIQAATVLSQPLPEVPAFAMGTDSTPYSFVAGDEGRELMKLSTGKIMMVDDPTHFTGKEFKGAKIWSNPETEAIITGHSGFGRSDRTDDLLRGLNEVKKAVINKPVMLFDKDYRPIGMQKNKYRERYINRMKF